MSREQFWFSHPFRVRYSEIDGQGVVFNAHYLTYFDTTITEYFRALGYDQYADANRPVPVPKAIRERIAAREKRLA